MKTNNSPSFWLDCWCLRGSQIEEQMKQKGVENDSKSKGNFKADFQRIFNDFGSVLGATIDPKSMKKGIKNKTDF